MGNCEASEQKMSKIFMQNESSKLPLSADTNEVLLWLALHSVEGELTIVMHVEEN